MRFKTIFKGEWFKSVIGKKLNTKSLKIRKPRTEKASYNSDLSLVSSRKIVNDEEKKMAVIFLLSLNNL